MQRGRQKFWSRRRCREGLMAVTQGEGTLINLRAGEKAEVSSVFAGCKARSRLASLGLIPGSNLQVITNPGFGPLLLSVGESRIMIERGIASKVLIQTI